MTVGQFGHVESVPVDNRRLTELIAEMDSNPLPASNANHWPEVRLVDCLRGCPGPAKNAPRESPHIRRRARQQRHGRWGSDQFEFDIRRSAWAKVAPTGSRPAPRAAAAREETATRRRRSRRCI